VWDKISAEDQRIILDAAAEASLWHRNEWEASEEKNAQIALSRGRILTRLNPEELAQFQRAVAPIYGTLLNPEQEALVQRVQALAR
jgi:TRAP-type C4-dicarboxylate transport system substrate-binding protein